MLDLAPHKYWSFRKWGVRALSAMGRKADALRYAEDSRSLNDSPAETCEEILLSSGNASGFIRVDWYTADGLPTWGDGRLFLLANEQILNPELLKLVDLVLMQPIGFAQIRDLALRFSVAGCRRLPLHHFDGADDQAERGPEFMAHSGQEPALKPVGLFRLLERPCDRVVQRAKVGDDGGGGGYGSAHAVAATRRVEGAKDYRQFFAEPSRNSARWVR